jgi:hypothetical protein
MYANSKVGVQSVGYERPPLLADQDQSSPGVEGYVEVMQGDAGKGYILDSAYRRARGIIEDMYPYLWREERGVKHSIKR